MRALLVAAFCVALTACSGSQVRQVSTVKASGEAENLCPTGKEELTPEMCANLPEGYGLTAEYPAEWGCLAMGRPYFGRLLCADGSRPEHIAKGTIVKPPRSSTSPPSPIAKVMRKSENPDPRRDFIDAWYMRCGGERVVLYTNAYRCGSPCVPKTFRVLSQAAMSKQGEALRNLREGSLDDALAASEAALAIDADAQPLYEMKLQILLQRKEYEEALRGAENAIARFPHAFGLRGIKVRALEKLERYEEAVDVLDSVLPMEPEHMQGTILCRKSELLFKIGETWSRYQGSAKHPATLASKHAATGSKHPTTPQRPLRGR